jgi:hypothetical protein
LHKEWCSTSRAGISSPGKRVLLNGVKYLVAWLERKKVLEVRKEKNMQKELF